MQRILQYFDVYAGMHDNELPIAEISDIRLMPNPVTDHLTVSYSLSAPLNVTISIYDMMGKLVFSEMIGSTASGRQRITVNLNGYEAGVYFYRLTAIPAFAGTSGKLVVVR